MTLTRLKDHAFVRYLALGGLSFAIYLGLTAALHEIWHLDESVAFAIAVATVFVINFFLARHFVYGAAGSGDVGSQAARFLIVSLVARACEYGLFAVLHEGLGIYYLVSITLVTVISVVVKFFAYRHMVFERKVGS